MKKHTTTNSIYIMCNTVKNKSDILKPYKAKKPSFRLGFFCNTRDRDKLTRPDSLIAFSNNTHQKERYVLVNAKNVGFLHLTVAILHCVEKTIQVKPQVKRKIKRNLNAKTTQ